MGGGGVMMILMFLILGGGGVISLSYSICIGLGPRGRPIGHTPNIANHVFCHLKNIW